MIIIIINNYSITKIIETTKNTATTIIIILIVTIQIYIHNTSYDNKNSNE